jgi:hypothetical protein
MPRGPQGQKRPADVIGAAIMCRAARYRRVGGVAPGKVGTRPQRQGWRSWPRPQINERAAF